MTPTTGRPDLSPPAAAPAGPASGSVIVVALIVAALYIARDILVPLALALLLSVALLPVVRRLRRWRVPRAVAAIAVVLLALCVIGGLLTLLAEQTLALATELPRYEANLRAKLRAVADGPSLIAPLMEMVGRLSAEISVTPSTPTTIPGPPSPPPPAAAENGSPFTAVFGVLTTIAAPLATVAVAMLLVAFVLLGSDDIRDRFIRLAGGDNVPRTTAALADATDRLGRFLLMQVVVNATFGLAMGAGLWAMGVPNAPLWGLLSFLLRFVPYVGAPISLLFPLAISLAVEPGWTLPLMVVGWFLLVELLVTYVLEVMLYGHSTGLSPLALLLAALFWTVLWGPVGLILAPALTACLAIVGRHVPRFAFLEVLLGNTASLSPATRLYQRLLAEDPYGAEEVAGMIIAERGRLPFLQDEAVGVLCTAFEDRRRGALSRDLHDQVAIGLRELVMDLDEDEEEADHAPPLAVCIGAAGVLDAAAAEIAAASLRAGGVPAAVLADGAEVDESVAEMIVICLAGPAGDSRIRRALSFARGRFGAHRRMVLARWCANAEGLHLPVGVSLARDPDALVKLAATLAARVAPAERKAAAAAEAEG